MTSSYPEPLAVNASPFPTRLADGYRAFRAGRFPAEQARYRDLHESGQTPSIMIIGCADSRVSPEVIFDAGPGEIFVVRNVANLVPPYRPDGDLHGTSAALEFAVLGLEVRHIVVMGHGRCGGIKAALEAGAPLTSGDFIGHWMAMVEPAAAETRADPAIPPEARQRALEHAAIRHSLANLAGFPWIEQRMAAGALALHGAWFDIGEGMLHVLDPASGRFEAAGE